MNIKFNEVTWYSRLLSIVIIFGAVPILVFFIGREYEKTVSVLNDDNVAALSTSAGDSASRFYSHQEAGYTADISPRSGIKGVALTGSTSASCTNNASTSNDKNIGYYCTKTFRVILSFMNEKRIVVASTTTDIDGSFSALLPVGTYTISESGVNMPTISLPKKYKVIANKFTLATLDFGIVGQ